MKYPPRRRNVGWFDCLVGVLCRTDAIGASTNMAYSPPISQALNPIVPNPSVAFLSPPLTRRLYKRFYPLDILLFLDSYIHTTMFPPNRGVYFHHHYLHVFDNIFLPYYLWKVWGSLNIMLGVSLKRLQHNFLYVICV